LISQKGDIVNMTNKQRIDRFKSEIQGSFDGALITPGSNLFYLSGMNPRNVMERLFILVVYPDKKPSLILPKLFEDEIEKSRIDLEGIHLWGDTDDPYELLSELLDDLESDHGKLLIEDSMPADTLMNIKDDIEKYDWISLDSKTSGLRKIKNNEEIKFMKKAAEIADKTYNDILEEDMKGMTEKKLASLIDYLLKKNGAEETSFKTIVASGPNSANPHHTPTERKIMEGNLLIMDFGAKYEGYCSDITRTIAIGDISDNAEKIYNIVKKALYQAKKISNKGIEARKIDKTARDFIKNKGYGKYFKHRVGHGIGLDAHEEPYLTEDNEEKVKRGMTFTIEPGIYLKGEFGVRIEDDMWVKKSTSESLTKSGRDIVKL